MGVLELKIGTEASWLAQTEAIRTIKIGHQANVIDSDNNVIYSVFGNGVDDIFDLPRSYVNPLNSNALPNPFVFGGNLNYKNINIASNTTWTYGTQTYTYDAYEQIGINIETGATLTLSGFPSIVTDAIGGTTISGATYATLFLVWDGDQITAANVQYSDVKDLSLDVTPPSSLDFSLASDNSYILVTVNEQVNTSAGTAITSANFSLVDVDYTGDDTTSLTIASVTDESDATIALLENQFKVNLTSDNPSNGSTAFKVRISNIEDEDGNEVLALTTSEITLNNVATSIFIALFGGTDVATYFDETDPNSRISESGGNLVLSGTDSTVVTARRVNFIRSKTAYRKTLADGEKATLEIDGFTWGSSGFASNDVFDFGIYGNNNWDAVWRTAASDNVSFATNYFDASNVAQGNVVSSVDKSDTQRFKIEYTRNAGTPASSLIEWFYHNGTTWVSERTANADLGDIISGYATVQYISGRTSEDTFITSMSLY